MNYPPSLRDGSDPDYAPLLQWSGDVPWWRASKKYREKGYTPANVKLTGKRGDGLDRARAAECRKLTVAMIDRYDPHARKPPRTWGELIDRYLSDAVSPYRQVKAKTAESYRWLCDRWRLALDASPIASLDYEAAKGSENAMRAKGRTDSYVHRMFTMLRALASYGELLRAPGAADVSRTLSRMRFKMPARRSSFATRDQVLAVIQHAEANGMRGFALGLLIQWTFALRGVDVFGQWEPATEGQGGIVRTTRREGKIIRTRWIDGLTWDMIEPDLSAFEKVISKTRNALPEPTRFPLSVAPAVLSRLQAIPSERRVGPVILADDTGLPYTTQGRSQAFRRLARDLGLPEGLWMMDTRSGALSEGQSVGATQLMLRDAAGHLDASTTDRYLRGREENIANVVRLRG